MEEVEEEFQSLSFHQHYTSSGVRSIPLQGGSAGSNPAPTIPDHQLMEEEEDGAPMHQPSSTAAAPSRSMANDTAGVVKLKDASTVPATKEFHQIKIDLEINISTQGIHPFGMATRPAIDEFAAGNITVQQGDRLGEVSAVGLPIGEEVLIRPWDVWIGYAGQHRQGLVYYVRKGRMNTNGEDPTPYNKEEARHGTGRVRKEPVARNHHRGDDTAGVVGLLDAFTVPMMGEQYQEVAATV